MLMLAFNGFWDGILFVIKSTGPIQTLLNGLMAKADRSAFKNNPKRALENSNGCFKYSDWIFRYDLKEWLSGWSYFQLGEIIVSFEIYAYDDQVHEISAFYIFTAA